MAFVNSKVFFFICLICFRSRFQQMFQLLTKQGNAKYERNCIPVVYNTTYLLTSSKIKTICTYFRKKFTQRKP